MFRPKETFVNAFIFNALMMNIYMFALTNYMTEMFRTYVRGTDIALIMDV
jgi:hypothetical protein